MTGRLMKYAAFSLFPVLIAGCEKNIVFHSPDFEQKLVIVSFLSPADTDYFVSVTSNQPLYGFVGHREDPGNITGTVDDGLIKYPLIKEGGGYHFRPGNMELVPGKTYTLKVTSDKGLTAEASATIPRLKDLLIEIDTESVVHEGNGNFDDWREFKIKTEFSDDPDETNFYSVTGRFIGYKTYEGFETSVYKERLWFEESFLRDVRKDQNNRIKLETGISRSYQYYDSAFIMVYVMNTEESYYLYHKSLLEYNGSDNPFSEAKPLYSNIRGGLGIFTSYTLDSLRFRLK